MRGMFSPATVVTATETQKMARRVPNLATSFTILAP